MGCAAWSVTVFVGVRLSVTVGVFVIVRVLVGVKVTVGVWVSVGVFVAVRVSVAVGVLVAVWAKRPREGTKAIHKPTISINGFVWKATGILNFIFRIDKSFQAFWKKQKII